MSETKMTAAELWRLYAEEETAEEVHEDGDQDDYETNYNNVYKTADGRYWQIFFCRDGQGNYNSWRDGDADDPVEVEPYEVTTTAYRPKR